MDRFNLTRVRLKLQSMAAEHGVVNMLQPHESSSETTVFWDALIESNASTSREFV
ncbi:hypothetical protein SAMN05444271_1509 [Halohasta litchfieldiae]|uniref:Uncharacterized protein n=1 Tax=Halohasta litchfieldiae TaxID=1073996 RepID=A0A1H6Y9A7_9EURY|nr:hypothetical protein SAMN05444271_1509 [Halohasta litchfieldiae]